MLRKKKKRLAVAIIIIIIFIIIGTTVRSSNFVLTKTFVPFVGLHKNVKKKMVKYEQDRKNGLKSVIISQILL